MTSIEKNLGLINTQDAVEKESPHLKEAPNQLRYFCFVGSFETAASVSPTFPRARRGR